MLKSLNLILLLLICCPSFSYSTEKLFPGYYIDRNGDSVLCEFQHADWRRTPQKIVAVVSGQPITLEPKDIRKFRIFEFGDYISTKVTYHTEGVSGTDLSDEFSEETETKESFLHIVTGGFYSLYEIVLLHRTCYFIAESNADPVELVYRTRRKEMQLEEDKQYRNTLFTLFVKENLQHTYINRINDAKYKSKDLTLLVEALNTNHANIVDQPTKKRGGLQIDVFVGIINNSFPNSFNGLYSTNNKFDNSLSPSGGLNFQYTIPYHFKSFAVGASFGYNHINTTTTASGTNVDSVGINNHRRTAYNEQFSFKNSVLLIDMYGQYTINPFSKVKLYLKGGLNCNFILSKNEGIVNIYSAETKGVVNGTVPVNKTAEGTTAIIETLGMYYNFRGDAGVATNRHKFELSWFSPTKLNPNNTFKITMIGAHYYFLILK